MPVDAAGYLAICATVGVLAIIYGLYQRRRLRASAAWNQTLGTIAAAEVVEDNAGDSVQFKLHVRYQYVVDGRHYTGNRVEFGGRQYIRKKKAQAQLERFPVDSSVIVYFNPDKPEDAVLIRSAPSSRGYLIGGILAIAFAIAMVWFSRGKGN